VTGRVQGVFFRASTQREARRLGVTGHAVNLPDGAVEVLACGSGHAVEALTAWLWSGPPHAAVRDVECVAVEAQPPADFTTG
jgi:acylphosphatase